MKNYKYKKTEWLLHSNRSYFKNLVEKTKDIIKATSDIVSDDEKVKFVISFSGGKDSMAMAHLVKEVLPETEIMTQFDDCDWPEKNTYIDEIKKKYGWNIHAIVPDFSVWEMACKSEVGYECLCAQSHDLTQESFIKLLDDKRESLGCVGAFIGLRADESRARAMNYYVRGDTYQTKAGVWRCLPLSRWKTIDVFAYLISRDIPINPCYFNNAFFAPEDIRLSWALPTPTGIRYGDAVHIKKYYPAQAAKLKKQFNI